MLLLLLRRRDEAVIKGLRRGFSVSLIADRVEAAMRSGVVDGRALSRSAGISRLRVELASAGFRLREVGLFAGQAGELVKDAARARFAADGYAGRWLRAAGLVGPEKASAETVGSVRRISATESAEAFGSGRKTALGRFRRAELLRIWDATLDRRTCPTCSSADGQIVGIREPFPQGEPGGIHPFCRCTWNLITKEEADDGFFLRAA